MEEEGGGEDGKVFKAIPAMTIIMMYDEEADDGDGNDFRRTADVRSVGYAELFVLSREDVLAALKDHPDAEVRVIVPARLLTRCALLIWM